MTDTFEFTLDNPLTEEQWDMITDIDFDRTDRIAFHTKHGKEVEFAKVRHGKWIRWRENGTKRCKCSECIVSYGNMDTPYCPNCGAKMDAERKDNG